MKIASIKTRVAVGAFILLVGTVLSILIFTSKEGQFFWATHRSYTLSLSDANGLQVGAPVRIAGLSIGEVKSMELTFADGKEAIRVTIDVVEPHMQMVRDGTKASLQTQGVLGDKFVALSGGNPGSAELAEGALIPTLAQVSFDAMLTKASTVIDNMAQVSERLKNFANGLDGGAGFNDLSSNLSEASTHLRTLVQNLARTDGTLAYLNSPDARSKMEQSLQSFATTAQSMQNITQKIDQGEGTLGLLVNDAALHDGAQKVLGQSNRRRLIEQAVYNKQENMTPRVGVYAH